MRVECGLSQEDAAYRCGLDRSYYGAIERGEKNVAVTNLWKISDGLNIKASSLFVQTESSESG